MFTEAKDVKTAEREFLQILHAVDKEQRADMIHTFVKAFKSTYETYKHGKGRYQKNSIRALSSVKGYIEKAYDASPRMESILLGSALGIYLGIVEFNLAKDPIPDEDKKILEINKRIAEAMKKTGKKIKLKFIKKRLEKIRKEHKDISEHNDMLIARMAAEFTV